MIDKLKKYYWVQKVLPLVYDNSLSYYEMLCKIREKLNETIEEVNALDGRVTVLEEQVENLDERVTQCEEDIDGLELRMDDVEEQVGNLDERVSEAENDIDDLTVRMGDAEENIDGLLNCCEEVGDQIEQLTQDVQDAVDRTENLPENLGNRGQVLTVNADESAAVWADVPEELPSIAGNAGKFLAVNTLENSVEWSTVAGGGLPAISGGDEGKVLAVNQDGDGVEWVTVQGGGGLPPYGLGDEGKVLTVNDTVDAVEWKSVDFDKLSASHNLVFHYTDYGAGDLNEIVDIVNAGYWTEEQLRKYDFNLDGKITLDDRTILSNMLENDTDYIVSIKTEVDPEKPELPISVSSGNDVLSSVGTEIVKGAYGKFGMVNIADDTYLCEDGYFISRNSSGEQLDGSPNMGFIFRDEFGSQIGWYPPNAKRFLQENDIGVNNLEGCAYWEGSQSGSDTYSLSNDHTYLLTFVRRNSTSNASTGVWIISSFSGASNVVAIKSTPDANVSVSGLNLTVTKNIAYWRVTLTRLA